MRGGVNDETAALVESSASVSMSAVSDGRTVENSDWTCAHSLPPTGEHNNKQ